ncbi:hypothetical protein EHV15_21505 [Paenibacillus oralis]|uniref:Uncharacterized protein n=1 Tax=Paenibacillus oralis TaxID=2490856 RepID=A0A3P3U4A9_9BACL|nr:hypothetical protein [Paenibacillus oralis]RRJ65202.1 hypothetical protein EHV15_21505 [Paenibacillus oralis]
MKKSGLSLMNLVFFIPAIILSVLVWNDSVVQPPGFEYRVGERANLALVQGMARIHSYGNDVRLEASGQISAQGEVVRIGDFP